MELTVLSYNVLARVWTNYPYYYHTPAHLNYGARPWRHVPLHLEPPEAERDRHAMAVEEILASNAHVACLQEVDDAFTLAMTPAFHARYHVVTHAAAAYPRAGVLLHKDTFSPCGPAVFLTDGTASPACTDEWEGHALVVPVVACGARAPMRLWVVAVHLNGDREAAWAQARLLQRVQRVIGRRCMRVVLAGDFNANAARADALCARLSLSRVPAPAGTCTYWAPEFLFPLRTSHHTGDHVPQIPIDFIFHSSAAFTPIAPLTVAPLADPWRLHPRTHAVSVHSASDHCMLLARLAPRPPFS
mmetsp:Transcript_19211/g.48799  ORF Transcript_19211/g.48799 Transcript_19211/m.48799 type:complete len:302 (+) Transcript_19211:293-1198(+)